MRFIETSLGSEPVQSMFKTSDVRRNYTGRRGFWKGDAGGEMGEKRMFAPLRQSRTGGFPRVQGSRQQNQWMWVIGMGMGDRSIVGSSCRLHE
jgi:hypothetical protein